jgi:hypothetical protein
VTVAGTNNQGITVGFAPGATGTLTINSGSLSQSPSNTVTVLTLAGAAVSTGTVNLNGGLLAVNCVANGAGGTSTFNFNGGTLQAVNDAFASAFMDLKTAMVRRAQPMCKAAVRCWTTMDSTL